MENAGRSERAGDFLRIVARIERGLRELDERRGSREVGESAEADHRTSGIASHAADAVQGLGRMLHLPVR